MQHCRRGLVSMTDTIGLTLEKLAEQVRPILNDLCVICHSHELFRLIGVMEDPTDFYYIGADLRGQVTYFTAVGHCESIRGGLSPAYYDSMDEKFTFNGSPPVSAMRIERHTEMGEVNLSAPDCDWLNEFRSVLSNLGLSVTPSNEELSADLFAQMRRVNRRIKGLFAQPKTRPGCL